MKKKSLKEQLAGVVSRLQDLQKYSLIGFIGLLCLIYGFLLFRINTLANEQPSEDAINSQVSSAHVPHIDKTIVQRLKNLQDNSVSVKALFEETRSNPFNQ